MPVSNEGELESIKELLKEITDSLLDWDISGLECQFLQDIHVASLIRVGEEAIPKIQSYLVAQAELEKKLVNSLLEYYHNKRRLEKEHRKIVTSPTIPPYVGSNENADALSLCVSKMEANNLVFAKRWGGRPDSVTGFSSPKGCPSRTGVEGALWALESIRNPSVVPLLEELIEQADSIQRVVLPIGYCSVFTTVHKSLRRIQERA